MNKIGEEVRVRGTGIILEMLIIDIQFISFFSGRVLFYYFYFYLFFINKKRKEKNNRTLGITSQQLSRV
jgi:hypothetical protein